MTFNRLQRIGIVLSAMWFIGATIYYENETTKLNDRSASTAYSFCIDRREHKMDEMLDACLKEMMKLMFALPK